MRTYTRNTSRQNSYIPNRPHNPAIDIRDIKATWWNAGGIYKVVIDSNLEKGKTYLVNVMNKGGGTKDVYVKVFSVKGTKSFASQL